MPREGKQGRKATKISVKLLTSFDIFVKVPLSRQKFRLPDIQQRTTVIDLKQKLELVAGIPTNLQRLHYLDKEDLADRTDLRSNDVVQAATLTLQIWRTWEKLVSCVLEGDIDGILKNEASLQTSADIDPALLKLKEEDMKYKLSIALFVASHRGQKSLVDRLIMEGGNVNAKTIFGRTPLHAAAANGQSSCIDLLLEKNASPEIADNSGKTASAVANESGNRDSEKKLFLFQWEKRAKATKQKKTDSRVMMHQQFDSGFPTWRRGKYQQVYLCQTLPAGEFSGTAINAPRKTLSKFHLPENLMEERKVVVGQEGENEEKCSKDNDIFGEFKATNRKISSVSDTKQHHPGKRVLLSHDDWLREKEATLKEKKELEKFAKEQEEKRKPWEKETKNGKKHDGNTMTFSEWQRGKSKKKSALRTSNGEKPKRKIETYEEYDLIPEFEKQLLKLHPFDNINVRT